MMGRISHIGAIVALALTAPAGPAARAQSTAVPAGPVSRATATENRARIKVAPTFVDGPAPRLPAAEQQLGHHGTAIVEGIVDLDGRMHEALVKSSSGLGTLDELAMNVARASTFKPATDAAGSPIAVIVSTPVEMVSYKSAKGGIFDDRCEQLVRDMDWWRGAHPDRSFRNHELYTMELGVIMMTLIGQAGGDQAQLRQSIAGFEGQWSDAIERCRRKPKMLQKAAIFK